MNAAFCAGGRDKDRDRQGQEERKAGAVSERDKTDGEYVFETATVQVKSLGCCL